jgi:ubiquitin carboxyl-terminal hydrolase 22/27/51
VLCLPPLKAHYLSGGHCARACAARRAARGGDAAKAPCLACEMDTAFARAFAPPPPRAQPPGARPPWSPATLLAAWWRHAESLASYQQQDAHEFFLSLVQGVHLATTHRGSLTPASSAAALLRSPSCGLGSPRFGGGGCADADCGCAMHRAFAGLLRSDVVCGRCGGVSTAVDPFVDVSLELPLPRERERGRGGSGGGGDSGAGAAEPESEPQSAASSSQSASLEGCLRRFCRAERLGPGERVQCAACAAAQPGTKQLSFAAAPPALLLHLKRFAHSAARRASAKLDAHVSFPLDGLDLSPFLAAARLRARAGHRLHSDAAPLATPAACRYWLAAAVCHLGELEGGHYIAYVRNGGEWFRCDDAWVTRVAAEEVQAAHAYMLFYAAHAVTQPQGGGA